MAAAAIALRPDADQDRVLIAIDAQFDNLLNLTGRRPLVPKLAPAARPIMRLAGGKGPFQGLSVHVSEHQNLTAVGIRCDGGYQPVRIEFRRQLGAGFDLVAAQGLSIGQCLSIGRGA